MWAKGFRAMFPITTGVFPFGLVMGSVAAHAGLTQFESVGMNIIAFAGASQLAVIELMLQEASLLVVVATGLIINLRMLLYSAGIAPILKDASLASKIFCAYTLTDQSYSCLKANEAKLQNNKEAVSFYLGAAICMAISWHLSVVLGFSFGNFLPASLSLDYAIPLSFVAMVIPTFKNKTYLWVALVASIFAVIFKALPYNLGLLVSVAFALVFAAFITRKRGQR